MVAPKSTPVSLNLSNSKAGLVSPSVEKLGASSGNSLSSSNRRQRERTTFDPQEEITRLMQIFKRTHHPTRYQIASICDSLNALACRKDKKPLEPYNIQYWFKNARAALRRKVKVDKEEGGVGGGDDDDESKGGDLGFALSGTGSSHGKFFKKEDAYDDSNCDDDELDEEDMDYGGVGGGTGGSDELLLDNEYFDETSRDDLLLDTSHATEKEKAKLNNAPHHHGENDAECGRKNSSKLSFFLLVFRRNWRREMDYILKWIILEMLIEKLKFY